jgi:pimeloyl-ACP methyl ester carboxylesterase
MTSRIRSLLAMLVVFGLQIGSPHFLSAQPARDSETVSINGFEMYYEVIGEGDPVVLLHGFLETGGMFKPFVDDLSAHYRLIIPDLRGHGGSTNPSGDFTMRQSAKDVFGLMDHLALDKVKAIGVSTGAMTLLHMATQQPNRIEAMVLVGAGEYYPSACREALGGVSADALPEAEWERLRGLHRHGDEQILSLLKLFGSFQDSFDDMAFTPPWLATIKAGTLLVHGDHDWCFPVDMVAEIYEAIPNAYLWVVPNGAHVPIFDARIPLFIDTTLTFFEGSWEQN